MSIRHNLVEYNGRPSSDYIHCNMCKTRVALVQDYILTGNDLVTAAFFNRLFNVEVSEDEPYKKVIDGKTLAETYCVQCRNLLGWKLIAVSQPSINYREGGFYMRLDKLIYWNDVPLFDFLFGGDNEQNADQHGDASEQNADQHGDANEQIPNEQDLGANEQNADQDGDANEENVDQDGDANEENVDQDGDANEENADQDGDANEQNVDQDGDANQQDLGGNAQNADQDEDGNEQDLGANEHGGCCSCLM
ncbi:uncharacterized protein LOC129898572 isoform X2 [Solanum dulcamara]|uniref:uncharacterized protein LOC129898572 isoform X2 n=1 Tax=Solanum dulcamara TaxID=45834 RepID=UPI002486501E|nr:uncharacterized protein LOC129898572 isoform X2 [Solanum dulcamara]